MEFAFIWLICGIISAVIASNKGRGGCGWFIIGLLLGPFGIILALVVKNDSTAIETKALQNNEIKKCPFCAEMIKPEAIKCRHCGSMLVSNTSVESDLSKSTDYYFTIKCCDCEYENKIGKDSVNTFPMCQSCGKPMFNSSNKNNKFKLLHYIKNNKSTIDEDVYNRLIIKINNI